MVIASYTVNNGDRAICFTSYNPLNLFKGKKIFYLKNSYEVKDFSENLISIPNYFDCIYIQSLDKIIIFQKNHFETIFKYKEEYINRAKHPDKAIELFEDWADKMPEEAKEGIENKLYGASIRTKEKMDEAIKLAERYTNRVKSWNYDTFKQVLSEMNITTDGKNILVMI